MKTIDVVAAGLVVVGALNWGLIGAFHFNLVQAIFGTTMLERAVYILVGVCGVWQAAGWKAIQHRWVHPTMA